MWRYMHFCLVPVVLLQVYIAVAKEYCQLQSMKASCPEGEMLLMTAARYGRMQLGGCLKRDYYVGCSEDVLPHLDLRCSGRRHCQVDIPDHELLMAQPCPKDIVAYLDADYECIKAPRECLSNTAVRVTSPHGYLAHAAPFLSKSCVYTLIGEPGQKINVTLIDFTVKSEPKAKGRHHQTVCQVFATIREQNTQGKSKDTILCSKTRRETFVYSSVSNKITIELHALKATTSGASPFVLKYQVVGCPNPIVPLYARLTRRGDKADVVCNNTVKSWHLVCRGTSWVGEVGNCTEDEKVIYNVEAIVHTTTVFRFPNGILVAVMIGVALGVFLGFILLFVVYKLRKRTKSRRRQGWVTDGNTLLAPAHVDSVDNKPDICLQRQPQYPGIPTYTLQELEPALQMSLLKRKDHIYESTKQGQQGTLQRLTFYPEPCETCLPEKTIVRMPGPDPNCHYEARQRPVEVPT